MSVTIGYDCLKFAIGLSRNNCNCYDSDRPVDANSSESDLFLDELEGMELKTIDALNDCDSGSLWQLMDWARHEAILTTLAELTASIQMLTKPRRHLFKGLIGEESFKGTRQLNTAMAGASYLMAPIRGGTWVVRAIGMIFNATDSFPVGIYGPEGLIQVIPVITQPNRIKWTELSAPLELPMRDRRVKSYKYDFVYAVDGISLPKENKVNCGCGGTSSYNRIRPSFEASKDPWSEWVLAGGIQGNDITLIDTWDHNGFANGIVLDAYFKCDSSLLVCDEKLDFASDPMAHVLAHTIRFKAGQLLTAKILSSTDIERHTMSLREQVAANGGVYLEKFNSRIAYLAQEMSRPEYLNRYSDCQTCKSVVTIGHIRL